MLGRYEEIVNHPRLASRLRRQASILLTIQQSDPRTASIFATQQRWLLAHLALERYYRSAATDPERGLKPTQFLNAVVARGVASRNTADAFLKQMRKYGYLERAADDRDRRARRLAPTAVSRAALCGWLAVHLDTLDGIDDGARAQAFVERPESIQVLQPRIADGLISSPLVRNPDSKFSLFTWLDEGGVVMDWLYASLAEAPSDSERIASTISSFAEIGERVDLSRTHLARKLRAAEVMGSLGWAGSRGKSTLWISAEFVRQYHSQQAAKLAVIDFAFRAELGDPRGGKSSQ